MRVGNNFSASTDGKVYVGNNLKISGDGNTVTGNNNTVNGDGNTVTGNNNKINGDGNRCTGNNNTLKGDGNTATGANNTINGKVGGGGKKRGNSGFASFIGNVGDGGSVNMIRAGQDGSWSMVSPFGGVMNFNNHPGTIIENVGTVYSDDWDCPSVTGCIATDGNQVNVGHIGGSMVSNNQSPPAPASPKFIEVPRETEMDDPVAEDAPDSSSCIICTEYVPVCAILPCMHKCVCCKCARELGKDGIAEQKSVKCPICRGEIEAIKRVY